MTYKLSRVLAWLRAFIGGHFWLPCPRCGRNFGGHEEGGGVIYRGTSGSICCPLCPGDSGFFIDGAGNVRELADQKGSSRS